MCKIKLTTLTLH